MTINRLLLLVLAAIVALLVTESLRAEVPHVWLHGPSWDQAVSEVTPNVQRNDFAEDMPGEHPACTTEFCFEGSEIVLHSVGNYVSAFGGSTVAFPGVFCAAFSMTGVNDSALRVVAKGSSGEELFRDDYVWPAPPTIGVCASELIFSVEITEADAGDGYINYTAVRSATGWRPIIQSHCSPMGDTLIIFAQPDEAAKVLSVPAGECIYHMPHDTQGSSMFMGFSSPPSAQP